MRHFHAPAALLALAACAAEAPDEPVLIPSNQGVPEIEQPTDVPEAVPSGAPASGPLGTTVASLGNPAEPGLWLKTPLVDAEQPGTVTLGAASVQVTLMPIAGEETAGSRMSIEAFQALGVPLTDLPEVAVSAG